MKMSDSNKKYILYVKASCPFFVEAEKLLSDKKEKCIIVPFDDQLEALEHMKWAYSHETVPMVFEKDENNIVFIGGYTDLLEYLNE